MDLPAQQYPASEQLWREWVAWVSGFALSFSSSPLDPRLAIRESLTISSLEAVLFSSDPLQKKDCLDESYSNELRSG